MIKKLDWLALHKTVTELGEVNFPKDISPEYMENEENLRKLHRIILDVKYLFNMIDSHNVRQIDMYELQERIPNNQWYSKHDS